MKVGQTKAVGSTTRVAAKEPRTGAAPRPVRDAADVASVMGIPEAELTPHVRTAIMMLMDEVARLRDELRQAKVRVDHLEELADLDTLVPLINRRAFVREISRMISYAERYGTAHSLLYFDLNGMKQINDRYGHAAGDAALNQVAQILRERTRESDIVGRIGGDEFGVLLAQSDMTQAEVKAKDLAEAIAAHGVEWEGKRLPLSVAYGVHSITSGQSVDDALRAADRAMYVHKGTGRE
jgi:diguanylate cyclase (GGDEF)-like protein